MLWRMNRAYSSGFFPVHAVRSIWIAAVVVLVTLVVVQDLFAEPMPSEVLSNQRLPLWRVFRPTEEFSDWLDGPSHAEPPITGIPDITEPGPDSADLPDSAFAVPPGVVYLETSLTYSTTSPGLLHQYAGANWPLG